MSLDRFRHHKASPDYTYLTLAAVLILFGLVMISSSSAVLSLEAYQHNYAYVSRQIIGLVLGLIGAVIVSRVEYRVWRRLSTPLLIMTFVLLLVVFIPGLGKAAKGAARWIDIGPFQLQPSEILKISFILYLSAWLEKRGKDLQQIHKGLIPFLVLLAPVILLLMAQRDMGTLLVILATAGAMFFVAGAPYVQLVTGFGIGTALMGLLILIEPYRLQRLTTFLNPSADRLGAGYHINQSLLAIGSGGWLGRGFGKSLQKYLYLPEPHTDSIFAITVEELGFLRSFLVLAVITLFAYRGYQISLRAGEPFGRLVAFGITSMFLFQSLINIAAILGLVPLTGIPLPLISYGGSSIVMSLIAIGIMINISRYRYG